MARKTKKRKLPFLLKLIVFIMILPWIALIALTITTNLLVLLYG